MNKLVLMVSAAALMGAAAGGAQRIASLEDRVEKLERQVQVLNDALGERSSSGWDKEAIDPYLEKVVRLEKRIEECCHE
jgi:hypothetical protein